jgi:hypothetical protein
MPRMRGAMVEAGQAVRPDGLSTVDAGGR